VSFWDDTVLPKLKNFHNIFPKINRVAKSLENSISDDNLESYGNGNGWDGLAKPKLAR
jgi:hypothetical protein